MSAATLAATLGACSSDDSTESATTADSGASSGSAEPGGAAGVRSDAVATEAQDGSVSRPAVLDIDDAFAGRDVIRTGAMTVVTKDLAAARAEVTALMDRLGGAIASESTTTRPEAAGAEDADATMQLGLQVPTGRFDATLEALSRLGGVRARSIQTEDVSAQVADVDSRVESARAALERIRALLTRADSLGTVIRLEGVLSDRQADLEALIAQQRALEDQTQLATVQLELRTPSDKQPPPGNGEDNDWQGFAGGLGDGWDALRALLVAVSTAVGVLLPFAVLAGLLVAPLLVWRRRRA